MPGRDSGRSGGWERRKRRSGRGARTLRDDGLHLRGLRARRLPARSRRYHPAGPFGHHRRDAPGRGSDRGRRHLLCLDLDFVLEQWLELPFVRCGTLFLGDGRPVLIGLHIHIDGKPYRAAWQDFVKTYRKEIVSEKGHFEVGGKELRAEMFPPNFKLYKKDNQPWP